MYKMIIKNIESDISKERIMLRFCKLCNNTEKGLTNIKNIWIINENGEILKEYERNTKPNKYIKS